MLPCSDPDRIRVAFHDHRLVANAGLILPVTLAHRLGLGELMDRHVDLGKAPGRANAGDKLLTLVASALATSTSHRIWWAKSCMVRRSVMAMCRQPARGSQNNKRLRVPPRRYS